jgi:geranylgeranyl diphosphate synthase type I
MTTPEQSTSVLREQLPLYKQTVEGGVAILGNAMRLDIQDDHAHAVAAVESVMDVVECGGKRTRGILACKAYEMFGGTNPDVAATAAAVVEVMHGYLLVFDDVTDCSDTRRGEPAAHVRARSYFTDKGLQGDLHKLGVDASETSALYVQHKAQEVLMDLAYVGVPAENLVHASRLLNRGLAQTGRGQLLDMIGASCEALSVEDVLKVAEFKTAYYSFLLPIQLGAALAGASEKDVESFTAYAQSAGLAFQLRDDIVGIFGIEAETGKPNICDIIEGKKTLLMTRTLQRADDAQRNVLFAALGNADLQPDHFAECLAIIRDTGTLDEIEAMVSQYVQRACAALDLVSPSLAGEHVQFLREMAIYGGHRKS